MADQAERLRQMKKLERSTKLTGEPPKVVDPVRVSITSGKGGVGKSNIALNTSIALSSFGRKVLLIDADTNLANLDILFGINPKYNLSDVIAGDKSMEEIIVRGPEGIEILPGSSGMVEMLDLEEEVQRHLTTSFRELEKNRDFVIIDTGAGLTKYILSIATSSDEVIIVTNPEPTAITDAYAMIKLISHRSPLVRLHLLVNMVKSAEEASDVYEKLNLVVQNFLSVPISYLGHIPRDPNVGTAVTHQTPFLMAFPKCTASIALRMTTRKLMSVERRRKDPAKSQSFLSKLLKSNRNSDEE